MSALRRTRTPPPGSRTAGGRLLPAPAVEIGPGNPQLGDHLIDRQQRVVRVSGFVRRGGRGPTGSDWRSRGRPVRGSATTDAPLRPPRQVRPPPGRRRQAAARGCRAGERGKEERSGGRAVRRGGGWRAARPCRRGRPAGAGAGSRAVADGAAPPLPGVEAAGPGAGRRGGLACRPGPQASTLHSGRLVKSPGAPGLTPGPKRRVDTSLYPPRQEGSALGRAGRQAGTARGARWRAPRRCAPPSRHRPPPGSPVRACPAARSALC